MPKQKKATGKTAGANASSKHLEAILQSIGDGVFAVDEHYHITFFNETAHRILGLKKANVLGRDFVDALGVFCDAHAARQPAIVRAMERKETVIETQGWFFTNADGAQISVSITAAPIIENDKVTGGIVTFHDSSDAFDLERMKSDFVSLASHQLRTPLTGIRWNLGAMERGAFGNLNQKQQKIVETMHHSANYMSRIIGQMLRITRLEQKRIELDTSEVELSELTQDVLEKETQNYKTIPKVTFKTPKKPTLIVTDNELLREVLSVLISNALQYTPDDGHITIGFKQSRNQLEWSIQDTGIGIPLHEQDHIFEKCFRSSNAIKFDPDGNGIGLYLASLVTQALQGTLQLSSQEGKGTQFTLSLPLRV